ncbi:MAG TPA: ABC transporter permease [Terriglobia bacterium]|nr:ABC transporter permease [Terriglobia bacterium]
MSAILQDLRFALRIFAKNPAFTVIAIITLALGIGANTAIFSVVNSVLLQPLPYKNPHQLVTISEIWQHEEDPIAPADFLDIQKQNHAFQAMAAYESASFNLTAHQRAERVDGAIISTDLFGLLGVQPILGRGFTSQDGEPGAARVVVLSDRFWKEEFAGSPDVLGKKLLMNDEVFTIAGIMPASFQFPAGAELWAPPRFVVPEHPLRPNEDPRGLRGSHYFHTVARLKPGMTVAQATADLDALCHRIGKRYPNGEINDGVMIQTLHKAMAGNSRTAILLLFGAVGLVLLIACANVANLELAHASGRQKEMAVRMAFGAGKLRIARQLLTEGVILGLLGGGAGLLIAAWGVGPLATLVPKDIQNLAPPSLDHEVLVFTLLVSVLAGIVFGLAPALQGSKANLNEALKESSRSASEGRSHHHLRNTLVVSQVALALILLIGAGLLVKSLAKLARLREGFDPENVLTARLTLSQGAYGQPQQRVNFVNRMLANVRSLPGVHSAAVIAQLPLTPGNHARGIDIEGHPEAGDAGYSPEYNVVSPDYFRAMRIPLIAGRLFATTDSAIAAKAVIINQTLARQFWPNQDAVGERISFAGPKGPWCEIVGVVGDVKQHALWRPPAPMVYVPYAQDPWTFMSLVVRSNYKPEALASSVRQAVLNADKNEPLFDVRTMRQVVSLSTRARRFNTLLLALFAALALVLATVGIYGVISYSVSQRTPEIGIRMALGAQRKDVLQLVVAEGLALTLTGAAIGVVGALSLTRLMRSVLYEVKPSDPATFVLVSLLLIGVATVASYLPARRATKVDPVEALRHE